MIPIDSHLEDAVLVCEALGRESLLSSVSSSAVQRCAVVMADAARTAAATAVARRLDEDELEDPTSGQGLLDLALTATCIICAALAAGLTMGVVSLDPLDLRVKMRTGSPREKKWAARLLPLVDREPHHQVLVTLLLLNSCANEALPLFLDSLVPSWAAILISVTAVLIFGEILPSALFTGPKKLQIAAAFAPIVRCFLVLLSPIAYPMSVLLDRLLHEESKPTSRQEVLSAVRTRLR